MVKIGIIGNNQSLQAYVSLLRNESGTEIIGKASYGSYDHSGNLIISVPEYAKQALFETADAVIIERAGMVPFSMLREAIKRYTHLFIQDVTDLTPEQCQDLVKLIHEAGTIVQVGNPFMEIPAIHWIHQNFQEPAYISISDRKMVLPPRKELLLPVLLFAQTVFNSTPQKIRITGIHHKDSEVAFINIRLDYPNFSAINFDILSSSREKESFISAAMPGVFMESTTKGKITVNYEPVEMGTLQISGLVSFVSNIKQGKVTDGTGLHILHPVLVSYEETARRLSQYVPWYT